MDTSDEEDLALLLLATSELDGIRCTKIEQVRFPLYYTIRSYTAFPNSTLLCEPVLGNPTVRFKLFACPRKRASYTRIVYSYVNSASGCGLKIINKYKVQLTSCITLNYFLESKHIVKQDALRPY